MSYECLEIDERGAALWVTLNRPQALNALNRKMAEELVQLFANLRARLDLRVVVLRGAGRAFCAGMDLKEHAAQTGLPTISEGLAVQRIYRDIIVNMRRCPQPIIGLLNGAACGGGFSLALATDVRFATPTLRMNANFLRIGFTSCDMGLSYHLPRMVGSSRAAEYMYSARFIDAERAYEMGLVSRIVAPELIEQEAQALVEDMLKTSPLGLRLSKEAFGHAIDGQSLEAVIAMEDRNQTLCSRGEDFQEAMSSFLEKRAPRYNLVKPAGAKL